MVYTEHILYPVHGYIQFSGDINVEGVSALQVKVKFMCFASMCLRATCKLISRDVIVTLYADLLEIPSVNITVSFMYHLSFPTT